MQTKSKDSVIKLSLLFAVAAAVSLGYLYYKEKNSKQEIQKEFIAETQEILDASRLLDSLERELDLSLEEVKRLGGEVAEYEALKAKIAFERTNLTSSSTEEILELRERIKLYESLLQGKEEQLQALRRENSEVKENYKSLEKVTHGLKETNVRLKEDNKVLEDSVAVIHQNYEELNAKVAAAALLKPINIEISGINKRGKEKDNFKSKKLEQLRIVFQLANNSLISKETKTIYLRLLDNYNNVLSDMSLGAGSFLLDGKPTVYTAKKVFLFTNNMQTLEFFYTKDAKFKKGKYTVELYAEGYKVGFKTIDIK